MTKSRTVLAKELEDEFRAVAASEGCELLDVEFHGGTLRVVLDHPDGVAIDRCARVSKQLSALLDVDDFGAGRYLLEVTSPGLDRPLRRPADWRRFAGRLVRVTFVHRRQDQDVASKSTVVARLEAFDEADGGRARLLDEASGTAWDLRLADVERARLEVEL